AGCRHEGSESLPEVFALDTFEHRRERAPGAMIVDQIVGKLRKLVENDVVPIAGELRAFIVDFLDVAFRAGRADDVAWIRDPAFEPVEPLAAHTGGQPRDAAAAKNARYRNASAAVIAGGGPDRPVPGRVEATGNEPWHEASIGSEHLVGADQRKPAAEQHDDQ